MNFLSFIVTALLLYTPGECKEKITPHNNNNNNNNPSALQRTQQAINGLMDYYWAHDPRAINISFFFSCGQIGGQGGSDWKQCSCNNPTSCVDCYRWWDAVAIESLATYGIHTNSTNHSDIPVSVFEHSPYNGEWSAANFYTYIDDFAWYGIAYLKVYEWLNDSVWLNRSIDIYEWSWKHGWDEPCGGFWWSTWPRLYFKDSITILEMLHFSSKLAYLFPSKYLGDAIKIWKWIFSFENGRGVLTESNLVSTGLIPELCCNASSKDLLKKCYSSKMAGTSYNQGLLMSSAAYLYAATEDKQYLDIGLLVLEAVLENYTTSGGMFLRDEMRGSRTYTGTCEYNQDPGGDWYSFNGVFMLHLTYFTEVLTSKKALPNATLQRIKLLVEKTSDSAWNNSAVWPPFTDANDACNFNTSVNSNSTSPKFHWWWVKDTEQQIMPLDSSLYFRKTGLSCMTVGNSTPLWKGSIADEFNGCEKKCVTNKNCSKYQFGTTAGNQNCLLWSYNRSEHICNGSDQSVNVGIKRPISYVSCKGHCGSAEPLALQQGVCYCDAACTKHLDCCLDYANECVEEQYISCKGLCGNTQALAIQGGGYCWCFAGCYPVFTDNNSIGSCCPDYPQQCLGTKMPVCLDARSQGSALNLFLAHMKIFSL